MYGYTFKTRFIERKPDPICFSSYNPTGYHLPPILTHNSSAMEKVLLQPNRFFLKSI